MEEHKLVFIKESLEHDIDYWKSAEKEDPHDAFYRGTVAGLEAFKEKIKFLFKEEEEKKNG